MPRAPKHCGRDGCTNLIRPGQPCPTHRHGWTHRTASSRATIDPRWQPIRDYILNRDHHTCQIRTPGRCTGTATVVDKVIPAARRPDLAHNPTNLRAACEPCNDHKARTTDRITPGQGPTGVVAEPSPGA